MPKGMDVPGGSSHSGLELLVPPVTSRGTTICRYCLSAVKQVVVLANFKAAYRSTLQLEVLKTYTGFKFWLKPAKYSLK